MGERVLGDDFQEGVDGPDILENLDVLDIPDVPDCLGCLGCLGEGVGWLGASWRDNYEVATGAKPFLKRRKDYFWGM